MSLLLRNDASTHWRKSSDHLDALLRYKKQEIGRANYIYVKVDRNRKQTFQITLNGFKAIKNMEINEGEVLDIRVVLKNQVYSEFDLILRRDLLIADKPVIEMVCHSDLQVYNQDVIEIFLGWDNGSKSNWKGLNSKLKEAWLVACLYWSGLPKLISKRKDFTIDGDLVNSKTDFYCLLGEIFFGHRGYFGQDLDGLTDCLNMIRMDKSDPPTIIFKNFKRLEKTLNKTSKNYANELVNIFENRGFLIMKEIK